VTTNVVDLDRGLAASDSRWSIEGPEHWVDGKCIKPSFLLFVDDAQFDKILTHNGFAATFAGDGDLIQKWKTYLLSNPTPTSVKPPYSQTVRNRPSSVSIYIADMSQNKLVSSMDNPITVDNVAFFAGSGAPYALECWTLNRDPLKAITTAKNQDNFSGGTTKQLVFFDGKNNLEVGTSIRDVRTSLQKRGLVMYVGSASVLTVKQAVKDNPKVADVMQQIANGALPPTAPCEEMSREWTDNEKASLDNGLAAMFGW